MPDITMCDGLNKDEVECPAKTKCYRYAATPNTKAQSWFLHAPVILSGKEWSCTHYWPLKPSPVP